jgi:hypothetical protein
MLKIPRPGGQFRLAPRREPVIRGMAKKRTSTGLSQTAIDDTSYAAILAGASELLESARHAAARAVNSVMTTTYWEVGRRIVEQEQRGRERAIHLRRTAH